MDATVENPLGQAARTSLMLCAGLTILLFYVFALGAILFLVLLLLAELCLLLVLLRFGLARIMVVEMNRHIPLVRIFGGSFWLQRGGEFQIALKQEDAPKLFAVLESLCRRLDIAPPQVVHLLLELNAHVRLKGYRRGKGTTILGIGYDLLAGMSTAEIEAVLAHEMTHAKQIRRGLSHWLSSGLSRIIKLTETLSSLAEAYRRAKEHAHVARLLLGIADRFARVGSRLVAAYSRQEEFDADRGAAELCGTAPMRTALLRMEALGEKLSRMPLNERVAQLQQGRSFSQWLVRELSQVDGNVVSDASALVFNKYSTHPLLRDRLANLPAIGNHVSGEQNPAITLLADPDALVEKLIGEIQRKLVAAEEKDSKRLERWQRKSRGETILRPLQALGVFMIVITVCGGVIAFLVVLAGDKTNGLVLVSLLTLVGIAAGVWIHRLGRFRDRIVLPVPDFALFMQARKKMDEMDETAWKAMQDDADKEYRALAATEKKKSKKERLLAEACFTALGQCDYLKAHVASRLCLEVNSKSVEGHIGLATASAAVRQNALAERALLFVQGQTACKSMSTRWGCAWACMLIGNWAMAEALLGRLQKEKTWSSTLAAMLALCRARRGKLQSAIISAREACLLSATNKEYTKQLAGLLLDAGYLREAQACLTSLQEDISADSDLMLATIRVHLLRREFDAADAWAERLQQRGTGAHMLVALGGNYELARRDESASAFYRKALETGFFPVACLGLARLAANERHKDDAVRYLLMAMDVTKPLGKKATGPLPLLRQTLEQLLTLRDPVPDCKSWIATFNKQVSLPALADVSFWIHGRDRGDAEQILAEMFAAMQPGKPPMSETMVSWQEAPPEQQPAGPSRPGIHGIVG
jgi:Zn-dependent protease with chaperone function